MPYLLPRTASVLAVGFLLAGPSAPAVTSASSSATGGLAAGASAYCSAHWSENQLRVHTGSLPPGLASQITSVAALSPTDVWMLITRTNSRGNNVSAVYHYTGAQRRESANLAGNERSFGAKWIVARSDTDVWVVGSARGALQAWQYNGSRWTDHPPTRYSYAEIDTAALDGDGILYLAGSNTKTHRGIILSYDGSQWTDLSPARPPYDYQALAVTADGALIAAGGGRNDGTLQERSGGTWTTISLSAPVNTITRVSVAPGGTVFGVGSVAGSQLVFIRQRPGSRSATVIDPPAAGQSAASTNGEVALGLDVWLLGEDEPHDGWHHSWITHDNSGFDAVGRRIAQEASRGQPCWPAAAAGTGLVVRSLQASSWCHRCGCDGSRPRRRDGARQQPGCGCSGGSGLSGWRGGSGVTWPLGTYQAPDRSSLTGHSPAAISPSPPARSSSRGQASPIRSANRLPSPLSAERQVRFAPAPTSASRIRWATHSGC